MQYIYIYDFIDHDSSVRVVRFHPQGDFFISGGDDKIVRLWRYTERRLEKCMKGHSDFIRDLDFHPSKPWIVSASDDQTIKIWNFMTGKLIATTSGHSHYIMGAKFFSDNLILSVSLDQSIRIWDCESLSKLSSKSIFMPDVIVKQIIDGHEREINSLDCRNYVVTGEDDKEVKVWEYKEGGLWEKEVLHYHQGNVTGVMSHGKMILSCGEDGLFCAFDLETRKNVKIETEGRFWCVAAKDNLLAAGHDSGFAIYSFSNPYVVCPFRRAAVPSVEGSTDEVVDMQRDTFLYARNNMVYESDLLTEKLVYKARSSVVSIQSVDNYILLQYKTRFEVIQEGNSLISGKGHVVLADTMVVVAGVYSYIRDLNTTFERSVVLEGKPMPGINGSFFCINDKRVYLHKGDDISSITLLYAPEKVVCGATRIAVYGGKSITILDANLSSIINSHTELVPIIGGFFYRDMFIYSTCKHIKYIFEDHGVLRSIDKRMLPFYLKNIAVDLIETEFKKAIISGNDEETGRIIEKGCIPGLYPLSYMVDHRRGDLALPYISDEKQRFELCLSNGKLEECLKYCRDHKCTLSCRKLADATLSLINEKIEAERLVEPCEDQESFGEGTLKFFQSILEECYLYLKDWQNLFVFYLCSRQLDNIIDLSNKATGEVCANIKVFLGDKRYFEDLGVMSNSKSDSMYEEEIGCTTEMMAKQCFTDGKSGVSTDNKPTLNIGIRSRASPDVKPSCNTMKSEGVQVDEGESEALGEKLRRDNKGAEMEDRVHNYKFKAYETKDIPSMECESVEGKAGMVSQKSKVSEHSEGSAVLHESTAKDEVSQQLSEMNLQRSGSGYTPSKSKALEDDEFDLSIIREEDIVSPYSEALKEALNLTTEGKFSKAVEIFRGCLYGVAYEITDGLGDNLKETRMKLGAYISELLCERTRKKSEDPRTNVELAYYFAMQHLEDIHSVLAKISGIKVCLKYGNIKTAQRIGSTLDSSTEKARKVLEKLSGVETDSDAYEIDGELCFDLMSFGKKWKKCKFCFVRSSGGDFCKCCIIGKLE